MRPPAKRGESTRASRRCSVPKGFLRRLPGGHKAGGCGRYVPMPNWFGKGAARGFFDFVTGGMRGIGGKRVCSCQNGGKGGACGKIGGAGLVERDPSPELLRNSTSPTR